MDSAGRVEKFKKRLAAKKPASAKTSAGKGK
jgi:ribosomal protein L31